MATTRAILNPYSAEFPATNFPTLGKSNGRPYLAFNDSTDQTAWWTLVAPQGLAGPLQLVLTYAMLSATSGTVGWQGAVEAITSGDAVDTDATTSFDTVNNAAADTVPGTAGYIKQVTITLTNGDAVAAADYLRIAINRDADGSAISDTATGDALLLAVELRDAA